MAKSADDDHGYKEEEIITPEMQQTEHKLRVKIVLRDIQLVGYYLSFFITLSANISSVPSSIDESRLTMRYSMPVSIRISICADTSSDVPYIAPARASVTSIPLGFCSILFLAISLSSSIKRGQSLVFKIES